MKSIMYSDKTSIHKHNVAGVTISGRNATVFSTVPGIAFDFTPKGMYMFRIEDSTGCKTAEQQPQPGSRRSLLADTDTSCWEDTYYDESVDENNEIFLEHFKVEECTSLGGLYSVITYSVLNEAGEWDAEYVDRWFADDIAPIFFDYHDAVGIALMSTTRTGDFNANTNEGAGKDSRNTTEDQHVHLNNTQDITQNGRLDKGAEEGRNAVSMNGFSIGHDEKGTNATVNGDSQGN